MQYNQEAVKILLRSPNWVGDAIMATPVIHALKKSLPNCTIHVLAKAWVSAVWSNHPDVEEVITFNHKKKGFALLDWYSLVKKIRQSQYDTALILPNSFSSSWMIFWTGIKNRIGYSHDGRGLFLTQAPAWSKSYDHMPRPQVYLNLAKLAGADSDFTDKWQFVLQPSKEALAKAAEMVPPVSQPTVGIAPGSVAPSRRWPIERYAQLIRQLHRQKCRIVLCGSPDDQKIAEQVAKKAGVPVVMTAGKTDLAVGIAVMKQMNLVISNDSGAMHMAYAGQVPVLVLQGAADPKVTGPFGQESQYIRNKHLSCSPCVKNECPGKHLRCMKTISVEEVLAKALEMLNLSGL